MPNTLTAAQFKAKQTCYPWLIIKKYRFGLLNLQVSGDNRTRGHRWNEIGNEIRNTFGINIVFNNCISLGYYKKDSGKEEKKKRIEEERKKKEEKERKKKEEEKQKVEEELRKKEEEEKRQQEEQEKKLKEEESKRQREEEAALLK